MLWTLRCLVPAFDEVALGVEVFVEGIFLGAGGIVRDDGGRAFCRDGLTEVIGIVSGVRHMRAQAASDNIKRSSTPRTASQKQP
jgi:hypothetical protein